MKKIFLICLSIVLISNISFAQKLDKRDNFLKTSSSYNPNATDTYITLYFETKNNENNAELLVTEVISKYKHRIKQVSKNLEFENSFNFIFDNIKELDALQIFNTNNLKAFTIARNEKTINGKSSKDKNNILKQVEFKNTTK